MSIRALLASGGTPSQAFRQLFEDGVVRSGPELVRFLYTEFDGLSELVMPAVMAWNRGTKPENIGKGLTDDRLNEIIGGFLAAAMVAPASGA